MTRRRFDVSLKLLSPLLIGGGRSFGTFNETLSYLPGGALRGAVGDHHKHHVSNGLYLRSVLDAINMPYQIVDRAEDIPSISRCYHHTRTYSRPMAVLLTRDLLMGTRT